MYFKFHKVVYALFRWGGKRLYCLEANIFRVICAKFYQNRLGWFETENKHAKLNICYMYFWCLWFKHFKTEQGIHRHQTLHRYCNAASAIRPIMAKLDVIHKSASTQLIVTPPKKDRSTAAADLHNKFREYWSSGSRICSRTDTYTDRQTDKLIAILRSPTGAE